jgi:Met-zincin
MALDLPPLIPITQSLDNKAAVSVDVVEIVAVPVVPHEDKNKYPCRTQWNPYHSIVTGDAVEVARWVPGSVIKWTASQNGFETIAFAKHAAEQMVKATQTWNQAEVGITFKRVATEAEANFVLCGSTENSGPIARAFFPDNNHGHVVTVWKTAFGPDWYDNLWNVLCHELGHVIGLRHEFATEAVNKTDEPGNGHRLYSDPDPNSVMEYNKPPIMQKSDIDGTKYFYKLSNGATIGSVFIKDYTPQSYKA